MFPNTCSTSEVKLHAPEIYPPLRRDHLPIHRRPPNPAHHLRPQRPQRHRPGVLHRVRSAAYLLRRKHTGCAAGGETGMSKTFSVEPCTYKALMRPRWSRDDGPECSFAPGVGSVCPAMSGCGGSGRGSWSGRGKQLRKATGYGNMWTVPRVRKHRPGDLFAHNLPTII